MQKFLGSGVIKVWGVHEIGVPIFIIILETLCEITDPPLKCARAFSATTQLLLKGLLGHSELSPYKQDGLHQFDHHSVSDCYFADRQHCRC